MSIPMLIFAETKFTERRKGEDSETKPRRLPVVHSDPANKPRPLQYRLLVIPDHFSGSNCSTNTPISFKMNVKLIYLCWKQHKKKHTTERKEATSYFTLHFSVFIKESCVGLSRCEQVQRAASVQPNTSTYRNMGLKISPKTAK